MNSIEATKYRKHLTDGGVPPEQAVAHADALGEVLESIATKDWVQSELKARFLEFKVDMLTWMFSMLLAQTGIILAAVHYMTR